MWRTARPLWPQSRLSPSEARGAALEAKATSFIGLASGSGVEVPEWLERLGTAVDHAIDRANAAPARTAGSARVPTGLPECVTWVPTPWESLAAALAD